MRRLLLAMFALAMLIAPWPAPAAAQGASSQVAAKALAWILGQQQADGGFPGFGPGDSADAVFAFVAGGEDAAAMAKGGKSTLDYLAAQAPTFVKTGAGANAKLIMAAVAADEDPTSFGGVNLLAELGKSYDPASGQYGADIYGHALALLAIRSVGAVPPGAALSRLLDTQIGDGGWSFDGAQATGSDTNTTGLVLQALASQRQADEARAKAVTYLQTQQNADGGFPYSQTSQFGNASDANSTAAAIQGLIAAGQRPDEKAWSKGGKTPYTALAALQNSSGALRYQTALADDNVLATIQAVPALLGKTLPVATTTVPGAAALVSPGAAGLPATGAPADVSAAALALLGAAMLFAGLGARRASR
jgi:hypothetical protein